MIPFEVGNCNLQEPYSLIQLLNIPFEHEIIQCYFKVVQIALSTVHELLLYWEITISQKIEKCFSLRF